MLIWFILILSNPIEEIKPVEWEGNLARIFSTAVTPDGRIFFVNPLEGTIYQTNLNGDSLPSVGKKGDGPLEFRWVQKIIYEGSHLYAYDAAKAKLFQIDDQGQFTKTWRLANVNAFSVHGSKIRASLLVPKSGHIFGSGNIKESEILLDHYFGGLPCCIHTSGAKYSAVLSAKDGTFWMSHTGDFRIDQYDVNGELLKTISKELPYYVAPESGNNRSRIETKGRSADLAKFDKIKGLYECGDKIILSRAKRLSDCHIDVFQKSGQRVTTMRINHIMPIGVIGNALYGFKEGDETTGWDIMLVKVYQDE